EFSRSDRTACRRCPATPVRDQGWDPLPHAARSPLMRLTAFLLLLLGLALPPAAAQEAAPWTVEEDRSRLAFLFTQSGSQYEGSFGDWTAEIVFDRQDLENSSLEIVIDIGSVDTGNDDRDGLLRSSMLFDTFTY